MIPALKKYPRPILPLVRKRIKQRNQRQLIKENKHSTRCRLKQTGHGNRTTQRLLNRGGEPNQKTHKSEIEFRFATLTGYRPHYVRLLTGRCGHCGQHPVGYPHLSRMLISFFLFFLCSGSQQFRPLNTHPAKL